MAVAFAVIGTQAANLKSLTDQMGSVPNTSGPVLAQTQANLETLNEIDALFAQLELSLEEDGGPSWE